MSAVTSDSLALKSQPRYREHLGAASQDGLLRVQRRFDNLSAPSNHRAIPLWRAAPSANPLPDAGGAILSQVAL